VQLASGRVVVPTTWCRGGKPEVCTGGYYGGSFAMTSDDLGASWSRRTSVSGGNEWQAAAAPNGSLLMSARAIIEDAGRGRLWAWSHDDGETWTSPIMSPFNDGKPYGGASCESSVVRMPGSDTMLFSTPFASGRSSMSVFASRDSGASWALLRTLDKGPGAYSSLAPLNGTHAALAYEAGNDAIIVDIVAGA
jgi:sialidase-1